MFMDLIRKHRMAAGILVFGPIIFTFILWGGSFGSGKGGGGDGDGSETPERTAIAMVGNRPVSELEFSQALYDEIQRRSQYGQTVTKQDLVADGTAERVLSSLVDRQLLALESEALPYQFGREFLIERLKKFPDFQDEEGNFDPKAWNATIDSPELDWAPIYEMVRGQVLREIAIDQIASSGYVLDSRLRKEFEEENAQIRVKYATVQPVVEPTADQIQTQYDEDPSAYDLPEERTAEFVAISLEPPRPATLDEIVRRARAGDDFPALVEEFSNAPDKDGGGDLGWITETLLTPAHQKVLFELEAGQVSDPVEGPTGYYIYKVEEQRTSAVTGDQDVRARQILVAPKLEADERQARVQQAVTLAAKAKESGDLAVAAAEAELTAQATGPFTPTSLEIDHVPAGDTGRFRMAATALGANEVSDPIPGQRNIYVVKITAVTPSKPQPLEAVRDQVVEDTIEGIRRSPEYTAQVTEYIDKIAADAQSLEEAMEKFPELALEVQEVPPFSARDYDYSSGPPWMPKSVFDAVAHGEPGTFGGPIRDYLGAIHFVELVERIEPDPEVLEAKWNEEKEDRRERALMRAQTNRFEDYLLDKRQRFPWQMNQEAFLRATGLDEPEEVAPEGEAEAAPETDVEAPPEAAPEADAVAESDTPVIETEPATAEPEAAVAEPVAESDAPAETPPAEQ